MENKKTIIYTGNFSIEKMNAAGKRVYANALLLQRLGYKVVLVGTDASDGISTDILETKSNVGEIEIYHYPGKLFYKKRLNYFLFYKQFVRLLETNQWDVKVIIGYNSPSLAPFIGKVQCYCRRNGIKHIMDVADWLIVDANNLFFRVFRQFDITLKNRFYSNRSDGIIAISTYLAEYYTKKVQNVIIIPPLSIAKRDFNCERSDIPQIVYAGVPFRKGAVMKNTSAMKDRLDIVCDLLCSVWEEGIPFTFHVYGVTKDDILYSIPFLESKINYLKDCIVFHGNVSMDEVQNAVGEADYTILIRENNRMTMAGFPTKVSESIMCGTPVITTDTSDIKKYLEENNGVFYIDLNEMQVAKEKIVQLLKKSCEERGEDKKKCEAIEAFSINTHLKEFEQFVKSVTE